MNKKKTSYQIEIIFKIKTLREERGISQITLSEILDISRGQVGNIESPKYSHKYTLKQIYTFCKYINYPFVKVFLNDDLTLDNENINQLVERIIEYDN